VPGYYYSLPFLDPDEIRLEVNHVPGKGVFADGASFDPEGFQNAGSRCSSVGFVDESAESVAALDLVTGRSPGCGCRFGRKQRESAVGALAVLEPLTSTIAPRPAQDAG
jgi:hypothetical protein